MGMLIIGPMTSQTMRGQALPEYLFLLCVLLLVAVAGVQILSQSFQRLEQAFALAFLFPSP